MATTARTATAPARSRSSSATARAATARRSAVGHQADGRRPVATVQAGDLDPDERDRGDHPSGQDRPDAGGQRGRRRRPASTIMAATEHTPIAPASSGARRRLRERTSNQSSTPTSGAATRAGHQNGRVRRAPRLSPTSRRAPGARRRRPGGRARCGRGSGPGGGRPAPASGACGPGRPRTAATPRQAGEARGDQQAEQHRFERQAPAAVLGRAGRRPAAALGPRPGRTTSAVEPLTTPSPAPEAGQRVCGPARPVAEPCAPTRAGAARTSPATAPVPAQGRVLQHATAGVRRALDRLDDLEHGQHRGSRR